MAVDKEQGGFWRWYGDGPRHLAALAVNAGISGYALTRIVGVRRWGEILAWLGGAVVFFDFVLFPLLLVSDWLVRKAAERGPRPRVPWLNHVRLPLALSALLLLLYFPLVLRLPAEAYRLNTGLSIDPYLGRWLGVTAALLAGSAGLYAFRLVRSSRS